MKIINKKFVWAMTLAIFLTPWLVNAWDDYTKENTQKQYFESYYDQFKKEFSHALSKWDFSEIDKKIAWYEWDVKYLSENPKSEYAQNLWIYKEKLQALKDLKAYFSWKNSDILSQASQEIDMTYVDNFIKNFSTYENPYSIIDNDYKDGKITKSTWQKAWNYIQNNKKSEIKNHTEKKSEEVKKQLEAKKEEVKKFVDNKNTEIKKEFEIKKEDVIKKIEDTTSNIQLLTKKYKAEFQKTLNNKISNLSQERLEKVIQNVDKAREKYNTLTTITDEQKAKYLAQLDALKSLLQSRLNELQDMIDIEALFSE